MCIPLNKAPIVSSHSEEGLDLTTITKLLKAMCLCMTTDNTTFEFGGKKHGDLFSECASTLFGISHT